VPDALGRPTPNDHFVNALQILNLANGIVRGVGRADSDYRRNESGWDILADLLQIADETIQESAKIERLRGT
jgi:hypothetical protein